MAQYSYDFSQQPIGSGPPAGWTEIGTSGKVSVEDHAIYGRGLKVTNLNTASFDTACIWTDLGTVSRPLEVVARYLAVADSVTQGGLLALANTTSWNAYAAMLQPRSINQYFQFSRYDAGAQTNLWTNGSTPVVPDTPYWARIRFNTDGTIDLKYWKDGDPEPSTWMDTLTDATYSSGYVGVEIQRFNTYYYFWIGVGTNGDPAPTSAGGGQTISESIGLGIAADVSPSATASAIDAVSLSKAFGAFLTAKAIVQESISVATSTDILDSSSAATARADVTIALAASLVNAARALAEAGVGVGSVIDITIGESAVTVRVELPSGRTLYVRADPRTYYIRKQDRTDKVK